MTELVDSVYFNKYVPFYDNIRYRAAMLGFLKCYDVIIGGQRQQGLLHGFLFCLVGILVVSLLKLYCVCSLIQVITAEGMVLCVFKTMKEFS